MSKPSPRLLVGAIATSLLLSGLSLAAPNLALAAPGKCESTTGTVSVFGFNDFHGRIESAATLFTITEEARAAQGADNVLLVSSGDNIGGSTFVSMSDNDEPTLDVLAAAGVDAIATGNHEYDKGWADLAERVIRKDGIPYLAANVYDKGTTKVAAPLKEYQIFEKGGVKIAVIGAVTSDLPSVVSPAGIDKLTIGDPVEAINRVAKQLTDGNDANGEANIIVVAMHEGAGDPKKTPEQNAAVSPAFNSIYNKIDPAVNVIFNGHTQKQYVWTTKDGRPLLQSGEYAGGMSRVDLEVDSANGALCKVAKSEFIEITDDSKPNDSLPAIQKINEIVTKAVDKAKVIGAKVIGKAEQAISTAGAGNADTRNVESPMSNLVAQMFYEQIGKGNKEFIGIQNPGGTRSSFDKGDITYEEAALVLPFANSLMTTQITGAQFKTVLEQQWQRDKDNKVPTRPFLALGLSKNVSYTLDESRPEGDRITSIMINGAPIDPAKLYTVGSGSFLIAGGDNFRELGKGKNTTDTGRVDLETWVEWVEKSGPLKPDYSKRGVSLTNTVNLLTAGAAAVNFDLGKVKLGGLQTDTLDMLLETGDNVSPQLANTEVTAWIGKVKIGSAKVSKGMSTIPLTIPASAGLKAGKYLIRFEVAASGTVVYWPIEVKAAPALPSTGV